MNQYCYFNPVFLTPPPPLLESARRCLFCIVGRSIGSLSWHYDNLFPVYCALACNSPVTIPTSRFGCFMFYIGLLKMPSQSFFRYEWVSLSHARLKGVVDSAARMLGSSNQNTLLYTFHFCVAMEVYPIKKNSHSDTAPNCWATVRFWLTPFLHRLKSQFPVEHSRFWELTAYGSPYCLCMV